MRVLEQNKNYIYYSGEKLFPKCGLALLAFLKICNRLSVFDYQKLQTQVKYL